ncbi:MULTISPECIES: NAD(P)-dependent oxidoreductase [unclassified Luteococcus]|uniref:NAD(P)-dependent oxidoreductase n=1 Tax=unclassified Luteococcus TaxID=2639923 RepID=UPI00313E1806
MKTATRGVTVNVGLIGYGEVGRILAEDLRERGVAVAAHDLKHEDPTLREHAERLGVVWAATHAAVAERADVVICAVTASQTGAAASATAPGLRRGSFYLDFNSASPGTKKEASSAVGEAGGRYVEGAVMTSVPPYRSAVPLLLGGPDARDLEPVLHGLGLSGARFHDERLGVASATKLCRSVMIKGLEAMVVESFTAARAHGVEDAVLASLAETFPGIDWEAQGAYFFQRTIEHGRRRSEEMFEAALAVREAGLEPLSATATAHRQAWMADLGDEGVFGQRGSEGFARSQDWRTEADRIIQRQRTSSTLPEPS